MTCPTPKECHEDPRTINFSDIEKNYTAQMASCGRSSPATTGTPSGAEIRTTLAREPGRRGLLTSSGANLIVQSHQS